MTTLILGCGYLGRRVAERVREAEPGREVYGTTRSAAKAEALARSGIIPLRADVLDPASLQGLPRSDRVLFCVAYGRAGGETLRASYRDGIAHALAALGRADGRRFVLASTTGVYGQGNGGWVDEESPTDDSADSAWGNLRAEERASAEPGQVTTVLRFSGLYGPGRVIGREKVARGEAIEGDPDGWLNLIHVEDAARAVLAAWGAEAPGPRYVASDDRPVRRRDYYGTLARQMAAPEPSFRFGSASPGRRVANGRIKAELGLAWMYPDFERGLRDVLTASDEPRRGPNP